MKKEILELFERVGSEGNCGILAHDLAIGLTERGYFSEIKKVVNVKNKFGDNPDYHCEHVCGGSYTQHFVVNCNGFTFDSKLGIPVSEREYLKRAYNNPEELGIC